MNSWIKIKGSPYELPLSDSEAHPISKHFSSENVNDFERGVQRDFSREITIEGSRVAMEYFNSIINWGESTTDYIGTKRIGVILVINGEQVMEGMMMILEAVKKGFRTSFRVQVFSREVDFLNSADRVKLSALDYSDIPPFVFNWNNVKASWDTNNNIYFWAFVDKGLESDGHRTFPIQTFAMYFYVKYLFEKICNHFGITIDSPLMEDEFFKGLVYGYGGGEDEQLSSGQAANLNIDGELGNDQNTFSAHPDPFPTGSYFKVRWSQMAVINPFTTVNNDPSSQVHNGLITLASTGAYRFHLSGEVTLIPSHTTFENSFNRNTRNDLLIQIVAEGNVVHEIVKSGFNVIRTAESLKYEFIQTFEVPDLIAGQQILIVTSVVNSDDHTETPTFYVNGGTSITMYSEIYNFEMEYVNAGLYEGLNVEFNRFVADMSCGEFFRGIIKMLGIEYYIKDDVLTMDYFPNFYKPKAQAINWDAKLDEEEEIRFSVIQNKQSRNINLKFEKVEDAEMTNYVNITGQNWGERKILNASNFSTDETDIKVPFGPVALVKLPAQPEHEDLYIPRFVIDEDGIRKPAKGAPRIGFRIDFPELANPALKRALIIRDDQSQHILQKYSTIAEFKTNVGCALFQMPNFVYHDFQMPSKNFYNFHKDRIDSFISDGARMLEASFRLKADDISNLSRKDLVKVRGSYWRVVDIPDVDLSKSVVPNVKLIKYLYLKGVAVTAGINLPQYTASENVSSWKNATFVITKLGHIGVGYILPDNFKNRKYQVGVMRTSNNEVLNPADFVITFDPEVPSVFFSGNSSYPEDVTFTVIRI